MYLVSFDVEKAIRIPHPRNSKTGLACRKHERTRDAIYNGTKHLIPSRAENNMIILIFATPSPAKVA
jgi:hypothetical protein